MPKIKQKKFQAPRGMHDILPDKQHYWKHIQKKSSQILEDYGFDKIDLPIVENTGLFVRAVGEATDVVEKEMYSFKTKGGDELSLRPELTANTLRAYLEHGMQVMPHPVRLWSYGPVFRHDNPQAGRYRQFHQLNVESIGDQDAVVDAEMIFMAHKVLEAIGLKRMIVKINSIGDDSCRPQYIKALKDHYRNKVKKICNKCKDRLKTNPLRVLDCVEANCVDAAKDAPQMVDYLDSDCKKHFKSVLEFLDEVGVPYLLDPHLVRGLDYYTKTVFEFVQEEEEKKEEEQQQKEIKEEVVAEEGEGKAEGDAVKEKVDEPEEKQKHPQLAVISGGRYDKLVALLGGPATPAIGWAMGVERAVMLLERNKANIPDYKTNPKIFLAQLSEMGRRKGLVLFEEMRKSSIPVKTSFGRDSIKSQLRIADRLGSLYTLIIGQKEALEGTVILREMSTGVQETIPMEKIVDTVKKRLKK
ncbi:MAG: histidine--tRNA ligase [bacterium]|nr:histidine--tRNA ligase [bacterium]